jgi:hypothetical protein
MASTNPKEVNVPQGLRPGDVPSGITWPRSLWIILPRAFSQSQSESFHRLRTRAEGENLSVSEVKVRNAKGIGGREFSLISPNDVAGLYRRAHRARTAVLALCGAKVLLDISELPSNRGCVTLERFVEHKCAYSLISRPEEVEPAFSAALAWMNGVHCEGTRDPRCFPGLIFEPREDYPLDSVEERSRFIEAHRSSKRSAALTDASGRSWETGPHHTRDVIQVGGCALPIGFHWDVQASRDSVITTGWERWRLPRRGYTNVHPDALVRGGSATKTHPAAVDKDEPKAPRTPRHSRSGGGRQKKMPR